MQAVTEELRRFKEVEMAHQENKLAQLLQEKRALEVENSRKTDDQDRDLAQLDQQRKELLSHVQREQQRQRGLLQEIGEMQQCIDQLQAESEKQKSAVGAIKDDCYRRIHTLQAIIKKTSGSGSMTEKEVEGERQSVKRGISEALSKVADVEFGPSAPEDASKKFNSEQQMEICLLISQTVCEMSKLYEKQIVLEKRKASIDFKKFSEKYER